MFNIADYLKKFVKIEGDSKTQIEAISKALRDVCGIQSAKISLKKGILYVNAPSAAKSLVYMKKSALIAQIENELPQTKILDIR